MQTYPCDTTHVITHGFHLLQIQSLCFFPLQELPSLRRDVLGQQTKDGTWSESTGNNSALWRAWAHLACVCLWPYSIDAAVLITGTHSQSHSRSDQSDEGGLSV